MIETTGSRLSKSAVVAFVLGLLSLGLSLATAVPALYVGLRAVREVNSGEGRLRGRGLAIAGMVVAGFMSVATAIGFIALVLFLYQEKAQRVGCVNNLRLIGEAVNKYHAVNHHYPAGVVPNPALSPERRLSWQAAIMPFHANTTPGGKQWAKLTNEIAFDDAWDAATNRGPLGSNVSLYVCPTFHRAPGGERPGLTSYIGMAGVGIDAARLPKKDPRIGFFGYDRIISQTDISAGTSATMVSLETMRDNGPWLAGGPATVRGLDPDCQRYIGYEQPFGGLHRGLFNYLRADGSVGTDNDTIAADVLRKRALIAHE